MGSEQGLLEALERAVQEVEALAAIYGYEPDGFTVHSEAELLAAQTAVGGGVVGEGWAAPRLEIELQLALEEAEGAPIARLRCALPPGYPTCAAELSASVQGLKRGSADRLSAQLTERAAELAGEEAVLELAQALQELGPAALEESAAAAQPAEAGPAGGERAQAPAAEGNGRRWIWAHHIKDAERRRSIVEEATERSLGGFLKPGYPGVVVIEGDAVSCDDFVSWIKGSKSRPNGFGRNVKW